MIIWGNQSLGTAGAAPELLSRLGLANTQLPHPAALYAEFQAGAGSNMAVKR